MTSSSRPAPVFSDRAIVLRSHKIGEADKVLRLLTREHGKRSAVAKGVRKTASRFGARLEPLTCASVLIHRGRSLDIVRQAEIEVSFHEVREDLAGFVAGSAMLELIDCLTQEHEPHPELFDLLLAGLIALRERPDQSGFTLAFFEFRALSEAGFGLGVTRCSECGAALKEGEATFSLHRGGLICDSCRSDPARDTGKLIRLSAESVSSLQWMASSRLDEAPPFACGTAGELERLMGMVVEHWTEREFRSGRVMREMPGPARPMRRTDGRKLA